MIRKLVCAALIVAGAAGFACSHGAKAPPNEPAAVVMDAKLANRFLKSGASGTMTARIGLTARSRSSNHRPPVNLALLVDTSGSMEGKAIADARAASLALVQSLSPQDRIAVVTFDSKAQLLLPSTLMDDTNAKELREKISAMKATGTTDMSDGLRMAISEVQSHLVAEGVNRIMLVGDGVPNDAVPIDPLVAEAASHGISVTALGLGDDYDETLMGRMAQASGGRFFYVESSSKVASFFAEEVTRLHQVVARQAVLELHPGPGVTVMSAVGRSLIPNGRGVNVPLGDLSLGEQQEIVVQLATTPTKEGAVVEALDAVLKYQDSVGASHEERVFVGAKSTADKHALDEGREKSVEDALARAKDAATTLENIDNERKGKKAADEGSVANPMPAAAPAVAAPPKSAPQTRAMHDQAMRNFQAH